MITLIGYNLANKGVFGLPLLKPMRANQDKLCPISATVSSMDGFGVLWELVSFTLRYTELEKLTGQESEEPRAVLMPKLSWQMSYLLSYPHFYNVRDTAIVATSTALKLLLKPALTLNRITRELRETQSQLSITDEI